MPDKDIVIAKVAIIQRCLKRIKEATHLDPESLDNIDKQDIFVLNLQRAVQAVIDLATHIVASEGLGLPDTIKDNFHLLYEGKIIHRELAKRMEGMVGFRNIAVHNYESLDEEILKSILGEHLADLEEFYTTVLDYFGWK
ncbi:MAG: DUF86 domain-containing protein [Deltaproteobacteria bacterium]|nr:DUF86 domain-containing protein [Deltaproteobacteria bacterium]MBW2341521.1 DUF86 domain-containing protein [Deltaproteobacteria bacterium]